MTRLSTPTQMMVAGRLGLATGCLVSPDLLIGVLGYPERSSSLRNFTRMLGVRDLAIALLLLIAPTDRKVHRRAMQIALVVDVGDVVCLGVAAAKDPAMRKAAARNLPIAAGSALFSYLASRTV